ncbi:diguanylate cyclase domain-containing protein [Cytobacillus gottheilii]|uniref:diguanylate cyclase domain-containing protein n=1 Tax=Cytobacillus gottheilii TaxID=859144 RepID=UPI0009B96A76|nr:diguanylate cyclase [Cytobacillus gottheilii]
MPLVSEPYTGATGRLMILVSVPVTDQSGLYAGYLGGTIYLEEYNSLKTVLGQHPLTGNKSYVYVVDSNGTIIYHPNKNYVNKNVRSNFYVQEVMKGKTGSLQGENSQGIDMLAGYAPTAASIGWGIISQTPVNTILEPTTELLKQSILNMIPFMIFILVFSIIFLTKIVHPIRDLALYAQNISRNKPEQIKQIPAWYFEARELKKAILVTVAHYQTRLIEAESESKRDQLTGLYNRRALDKMIEDMNQYSLILFDIDYFKNVNDQYGHLMGDQVLIYTAETILAETKNTDFCFRWGGEEFLILLPETKQEEAYFISERIRETFARTLSPIDKPITISAGVGTLYETSDYFSELLHLTDQALYEAKHSGRNTTIRAKKTPKLK